VQEEIRMSLIDRWFLAHPRGVGESYWEHALVAGRFGSTMVVGGVCCLVHAVVPALFPHSASERVKQLYLRMKARQPAFRSEPPAFADPAWQLEYEI
jgi:hypothetical protein